MFRHSQVSRWTLCLSDYDAYGTVRFAAFKKMSTVLAANRGGCEKSDRILDSRRGENLYSCMFPCFACHMLYISIFHVIVIIILMIIVTIAL